jgi:hypothetical protein
MERVIFLPSDQPGGQNANGPHFSIQAKSGARIARTTPILDDTRGDFTDLKFPRAALNKAP